MTPLQKKCAALPDAAWDRKTRLAHTDERHVTCARPRVMKTKATVRRSLVPLLIVGGDLVAKIIGIVLERADKDDVIDDGFTALILFAGGIIVLAWLYFARRPASS